MSVGDREKHDPAEAAAKAEDRRGDPQVKSWMRRFRKLMKDQPAGTWIYWQEDTMNLMALGPNGERYTTERGNNAGSDTRSVIDSHRVPGSDAGAW